MFSECVVERLDWSTKTQREGISPLPFFVPIRLCSRFLFASPMVSPTESPGYSLQASLLSFSVGSLSPSGSKQSAMKVRANRSMIPAKYNAQTISNFMGLISSPFSFA
jgi:hypothetical protein